MSFDLCGKIYARCIFIEAWCGKIGLLWVESVVLK